MHVHLKRAGAVAFLASAGALLSSACVQDESSLFIRSCLAIPKDSCIVQPSTTAPFLTGGFIDAVYRSEYTCDALVENQLVARGDVTKLRTETSHVEFYEAKVQVFTTDQPPKLVVRADKSVAQFTVPITGFADPGMGGQPGLGVAGIVLLDYATLSGLKDQAAASGGFERVVAWVTVKGRTTGGLEVHTNEFKFPIEVCSGCRCMKSGSDPCAGGASKPTPDCEVGQDGPVDCRALDACSQLECDKNVMGFHSLSMSRCPANPMAVNGTCCNAVP